VWLVQNSAPRRDELDAAPHLPGPLRCQHAGDVTTLDTLHRNVVVQQTLASPTGVRLFDFALSPGVPPGTTGTGTLAVAVTTWAARRLAEADSPRWRPVQLDRPGQLVADATCHGSATSWRGAHSSVPTSPPPWRSWPPRSQQRGAPVTPAGQGPVHQRRVLSVAARIQEPPARAEACGAGRLPAGQSADLAQSEVGHGRGPLRVLPHRSRDVAGGDHDASQAGRGSLQLYVQRCFLQLEAINVDSDSVWKQWDWMKRFRLWEANRKIFLYPETVRSEPAARQRRRTSRR